VATVRAVKHHGGFEEGGSAEDSRKAIEAGMANVQRHLALVKEFGLPCVVAVNRRPGDTDEEVQLVRQLALEAGAFGAELNEAFEKGGDGASDLAEAVCAAADQESKFEFLYESDDPIKVKIEKIARKAYGADDVVFYLDAERKIEQYTDEGLDQLPICMAKTPLSLSHDPTLLGAPTGFTLPIRDMRAYTGAGWLVPLCGDIQQMPGLGKTPAAFDVDIDETGRTIGLF
jgi:formyltetrahydrofolate synthetase